MKIVKNTSMQGLYVAFEGPEGPAQRFVAAKSSVEVPESWGGRAMENLIKRRMIKVTNSPVAPVPVTSPKKIIRKSK
tara:strand:- start:302 stop:532 length:231 start_codon:yes stop_codon:yes gene_type:complete